jgi:hypothetical protein
MCYKQKPPKTILRWQAVTDRKRRRRRRGECFATVECAAVLTAEEVWASEAKTRTAEAKQAALRCWRAIERVMSVWCECGRGASVWPW